MKNKYVVYQDGGQTDDGSGTDVFNGYVDQLLASINNQQEPNSVGNVEDTDSDFINNLRSFDDEQKQPIFTEDYFKSKLDEFGQLLDSKLNDLHEQQQQFDWFESPQGNDYVANQYDTQGQSVNVGASYGDNTGVGQNNYGNLRGQDGQFMSFDTPEEGHSALIHQLELYKTGRTKNPVSPNSTLYQAMAVYAPVSDNNNPKHYAEFVAKRLGISPNTPIKDVDSQKWADAISAMEGNKNIH